MINELLKDHTLFHTEFQQDYYITGMSGGTTFGKYKQSLRELYKRLTILRDSYCDREKLEVEIQEKEHISIHAKDEFKRKYAAIELKRKKMRVEEHERTIHDTEKEFKRFYEQAITYKRILGDLTEEKKKELEKEMHIFQLKENIVIDLVSTGRLINNTYEAIMALPNKEKKIILSELQDTGKLIKWYENKNDEEIEIIKLDINPVKLLESFEEVM